MVTATILDFVENQGQMQPMQCRLQYVAEILSSLDRGHIALFQFFGMVQEH